MLDVRNIYSGYGDMKILKGVSISVSKGELVGVIGANGAGKSTLLKSISGLLKINNGKIIFEDKNIANLPPDEIAKKGIIHVPEGRHIFGPLTTLENLMLGCYIRYRQLGVDGRERMLKFVFDLFPILDTRRDQRAGSLSGGEQQMLALARGLMAEPKLLFIDEPSLGLAPIIISSLCNTLKSINKQGVTILLAEQNAKATLNLAHRIYVFETGNVSAQGSSQDFTMERLKELYIA